VVPVRNILPGYMPALRETRNLSPTRSVISLTVWGEDVVFLRLRESTRRADRRVLRLGVVSLGVHTALILCGVYAIRSAGRNAATVLADTTVVFLESPQLAPQLHPVALDVPLKGFQTIVTPPQIPTSIPLVDLQQHFDPKDYSGTGVEGGVANGAAPTDSHVYTAAGVEEGPALLSPPPVYPEMLRRAGIQGRVLLQAIVDTAGRLEPNSVKILKSSSPGFDLPTRRWALEARFRPARLQGRAVRILVNLPFDFSLSTSGG
jgi:periplasmic protein TonB